MSFCLYSSPSSPWPSPNHVFTIFTDWVSDFYFDQNISNLIPLFSCLQGNVKINFSKALQFCYLKKDICKADNNGDIRTGNLLSSYSIQILVTKMYLNLERKLFKNLKKESSKSDHITSSVYNATSKFSYNTELLNGSFLVRSVQCPLTIMIPSPPRLAVGCNLNSVRDKIICWPSSKSGSCPVVTQCWMIDRFIYFVVLARAETVYRQHKTTINILYNIINNITLYQIDFMAEFFYCLTFIRNFLFCFESIHFNE